MGVAAESIAKSDLSSLVRNCPERIVKTVINQRGDKQVLIIAICDSSTTDVLVKAVKENNMKEVNRLIQDEHSTEAVDDSGDSALHTAAAHGNTRPGKVYGVGTECNDGHSVFATIVEYLFYHMLLLLDFLLFSSFCLPSFVA